MKSTIKVATIRGAGLTFPVICLLFLFFGNIYVLALLPAGALIGFGIGVYLDRNPGASIRSDPVEAAIKSKPDQPGWLASMLFHPNLLVRLVRLIILSSGLLLITWCIGYFFLPEGVFHAGAEAHMTRSVLDNQSASVVEEWSKIFIVNLFPAAMILLGSLLLRVNGISFGYLVALFNVAGYGLFLGTNSFAIPMQARMAPSLAVLERSGPYEMLALILLAAAAYSWSFFEVKQLFRTNPKPVEPRQKISRLEILLALAGLSILAAANWHEASMVIASAVM